MRWDRQNLFVIAGSVSRYLIVILPSFQMLFVITGTSFYERGATVRCSDIGYVYDLQYEVQ